LLCGFAYQRLLERAAGGRGRNLYDTLLPIWIQPDPATIDEYFGRGVPEDDAERIQEAGAGQFADSPVAGRVESAEGETTAEVQAQDHPGSFPEQGSI